jgi:hypothetical protein
LLLLLLKPLLWWLLLLLLLLHRVLHHCQALLGAWYGVAGRSTVAGLKVTGALLLLLLLAFCCVCLTLMATLSRGWWLLEEALQQTHKN